MLAFHGRLHFHWMDSMWVFPWLLFGRNISWESILRDAWIRLMSCFLVAASVRYVPRLKTGTSNYIIWAHMTLPLDMILACIHMHRQRRSRFCLFFSWFFHRRRIRMQFFLASCFFKQMGAWLSICGCHFRSMLLMPLGKQFMVAVEPEVTSYH